MNWYNLDKMYQFKEQAMENVVSISNARRDLPKIIREVQKNPEVIYKITVRNETIAEIRSAKVMVKPGEAVRRLIRLRGKLSHLSKDRPKEPISKKIKDYLYVQEDR
jgi:antitoxin (DNA-binding transcriptional repressor) of toxin-antitoxin stability system